jgi:probable HAF family extracellular repeat protein
LFLPDRARAALWKHGTALELGTLGGLSSFGTGLDDHGRVVGWSSDANGQARAFLYRDGIMIDLNTYVDPAQWTLTDAKGICNDGTIVGNGLHHGVQRGFMLTPSR